MRRYIKKEISHMLNTMLNANGIWEKALLGNQMGQVRAMAGDLSTAAESIVNSLNEEKEAEAKCGECLLAYVETLVGCLNLKKPTDKMSACAIMKKRLSQAQEIIQNDVDTDKLYITFMPYKADMWTSMSSIWETAMNDKECHVSVVPIPYYDITNPENVSLHYEADRFPKEVECIYYENYSEKELYPDIIVIHNPYDETNNVTRVPERFYSSTLVNHTAKLVYAPYFTMSSYKEEKHSWMLAAPANINADLILAQSERVKKLYENMGFPSQKVLTFGSPKIDAVVNMTKKNKEQLMEEIPIEWKEKIEGKKVFLLNTHLSYFPNCTKNMDKLGNYAVKWHNQIMDAFLNRKDCALIWRPHPLMKNMIQGRFPEWLDYIDELEQRIQTSSNAIIDNLGDYTYSFLLSDAMVTTHTSLINEYMVLKKPILLFQTRLSPQIAETAALNINVNYFRFGDGFVSFRQFRDNVLGGIDPKYDIRMEELHKAFPNLDGKAGEKIYQFLKEN